jgi:hypothetical protein
MNVYLAMFSNEITWGAALVIGIAIGALVAYQHGVEKGHDAGYLEGYEFGADFAYRPKRDAKGRFTK